MVPFLDRVLEFHSAFGDTAVAIVEIVEPGVIVKFSRCGYVGALMVAHKSGHSVGLAMLGVACRVDVSVSQVCKMVMVWNKEKGRRYVNTLSFTVMRHMMFCSTILPLITSCAPYFMLKLKTTRVEIRPCDKT